VVDTHQVCAGHLTFNEEFDRVYDVSTDTQPTWILQDAGEKLLITQSGSWGQSVVWNPGAAKCSQISDMPADGYQHMVCVEAARVTSPIEVQPAQSWVGWQLLTV
jgi:glucose-6-phosphate 1-epimerase